MFKKDGLLRSLFTAYAILLLHVGLVALTGVTVVLFKGVYDYLPWIMGLIGVLVLLLAWAFYQRMKNSSAELKTILSMPEFRDKSVEIKLLGGLASFKIKADQPTALPHPPSANQENRHLIEDTVSQAEQKILKLTALYEKEIITKEEFEKAKQDILQG